MCAWFEFGDVLFVWLVCLIAWFVCVFGLNLLFCLSVWFVCLLCLLLCVCGCGCVWLGSYVLVGCVVMLVGYVGVFV